MNFYNEIIKAEELEKSEDSKSLPENMVVTDVHCKCHHLPEIICSYEELLSEEEQNDYDYQEYMEHERLKNETTITDEKTPPEEQTLIDWADVEDDKEDEISLDETVNDFV
jgi:hypothetical protein